MSGSILQKSEVCNVACALLRCLTYSVITVMQSYIV